MGREKFFWPLVLRGVGIATLSVPLTTLAVSGLQGRNFAQGAALNNMMRQLGGSFGIALINTYAANCAFINHSILAEHVNAFDPLALERVTALTAAFQQAGATLVQAQQRALATLNALLARESVVISYADTFRVRMLFFLLCLPLVRMPRRGRGAREVSVPGH